MSNWYTSSSTYGSYTKPSSLLNRSPSKRTYGLSPAKTRSSPLGLDNLTNTCYISAVLQALFEIIVETDFPIKQKSQQELTSLFFTLKKTKDTNDYKRFKQALQNRIEIVKGWDQQDAHELLIELIEQFRKENSQKLSSGKLDLAYKQNLSIQNNWKSFVKEMQKIEKSKIISLLYGDMLKKYTCPYSHTKSSFERYSNLSLPFSPKNSTSRYYYSEGPLDVGDMIEEYLGQEIIEDLYCQKCKEKMRFKKRAYLYTTPKYLILHFSRFIKGYYDNEKNSREVSFDENIRIEEQSTRQMVNYKLVAVIHHLGSLNRGHYYANVKTNNDWYEFDDDKVTRAGIYGMRNTSKSAYLLFYQRV